MISRNRGTLPRAIRVYVHNEAVQFTCTSITCHEYVIVLMQRQPRDGGHDVASRQAPTDSLSSLMEHLADPMLLPRQRSDPKDTPKEFPVISITTS
jgi:hypothetical protein